MQEEKMAQETVENTVETDEANAASKENKKKNKKADAEIASLKEALATKEAELAEANDKYLRLYAEYDNFRKRSAKEREAVYFDAKSDTLKGILPVLDNMERATAFSEAEKILEGMNLILKSFDETLTKMDVKEIEALGKTFDPDFHYAVMHIEDESYGENEVVEVLQKGYICGDKVIRYAMVKVAN